MLAPDTKALAGRLAPASVRREVPPALLALKTKLVSFELAVPCTEAGLQVFKGPCKIPFDNAN